MKTQKETRKPWKVAAHKTADMKNKIKKGTQVVVTTWKEQYSKPVTTLTCTKIWREREVIKVTSPNGPLWVLADDCIIANND